MTGEEFKQLRKNRKISQSRLAEMIGYKGPNARLMIHGFEKGKQPPLDKIRKLAEILDVPIDWFVP